MSDSESSLSTASPSPTVLEQALRQAVQNIYKRGNLEDLTVKRVRAAAEQDLQLTAGFYKENVTWKDKSKEIIESEVNAYNDASSNSQTPTPRNLPKFEKSLNRLESEPTKSKFEKQKGTSQDGIVPRKKRKKEPVEPNNSKTDGTIAGLEKSFKKADKHKGKSGAPAKNRTEADNNASLKATDSIVVEDRSSGSESESSVLIDNAPKPKRRGRKSSTDRVVSRATLASKQSKKPQGPVDADAEEIKRLQGWLTKCGIRKMWHRELAPYDTPKLKIHHLKEMLNDAGMTGRYSIEKATQIRDERELKADLEAVQEGDKQWGKVGSGEKESGKSRRRLAKGLRELDFLNDDDGEETE